MTDIILYGAGEHGKVVADSAMTAGLSILGFVDDKKPDHNVLGIAYLGSWAECSDKYSDELWHVCIGSNSARAKVSDEIIKQLKQPLLTIIHPDSSVSDSANISAGCFIAAQSVVSIDAHLGRGVIINHRSSVDHDCQIGDFVHICPGSQLAGRVKVNRLTLIGTGCSIKPGVVIGHSVITGAGAVVVHDVADSLTVAGNPAKVI